MSLKILICNDDGIGSPFLPIFVEAFRRIAEVITVVPASEQSWIGRAYSRHKELTLTQTNGLGGAPCYTVDGTPADCVNIALAHILEEAPAAVVSGLNIGQNIAMPLLLSSGTFAAAVEGAGFGLPAFAFSQQLQKEYYELCRIRHAPPPEALTKFIRNSSYHAANYVTGALAGGFEGGGTVHNINYPADFAPHTPFRMCVPAPVKMGSLYKRAESGRFVFEYSPGENLASQDALTDMECLKRGYASCSKINVREFPQA